MFEKLITKIGSFADHHQVLVAIAVAICVVCVSWSFEQLLEHYVFPKKPLYGFISVILGGLFLLWLIQHYILHVL